MPNQNRKSSLDEISNTTIQYIQENGNSLIEKTKKIHSLSKNQLLNLQKETVYIASLPERTIRSSVSLATGVTSSVTKSLIPSTFRNSMTYKFTFGLLQQFLIESVAELNNEEKDFELEDNYVAKKTVGTAIEGLGLFTMNFSPLWVFAIISDVAGGSKVYLDKLLHHLKENNVIDENTSFSTVTDLLDGIRNSTTTAANAIDTPPISDEEFQAFKNSMKLEFKKNANDTQELLASIDSLWNRMVSINESENVSLNKISGTMVIDVMKKGSLQTFGFAKATSTLSIELFNDVILKSYQKTLDDINEVGISDYINEHMKPFLHQSSKHFHRDKNTLTEKTIAFITKKLR